MRANNWKILKDKAIKTAKVLVAGGLLFLLTRFVPIGEVRQTLLRSSLPLLIIAVGLVFAGILFSSLKLYRLAGLFSPDLKLLRVLRAYYIGIFFNNFLPTGIGGDLIKINELRNEDLPLSKSSASVVVERGMGLIGMLLYAAVFAAFWPPILESLKLAFLRIPLLVFLFLLILLAISLNYRQQNSLESRTTEEENIILEKVYDWMNSFLVFRDNKKVLLEALVVSLLFHSIYATILVILTFTVGSKVSFQFALGCIPFIAILDVIPISIGGLGVREGAITYALTQAGISPADSLSVALLFRSIYYFHSAIGGVIYGLPANFCIGAQ